MNRTSNSGFVRWLITLSFAMVYGCAARADQSSSAVFIPEVRPGLAHLREGLQHKRAELVFADGRAVETCELYSSRRASGVPLQDTVSNRLAAADYLICAALAAWTSADKSSERAPSDRGSQLAKRLDLRSFASSLGPQLDGHQYLLTQLGTPLRIAPSNVSLVSEDATVTFEVVAEADFDHDGHADWLVWLLDEAKEGTYRDYRTLIVSHVARAGRLTARDLWPRHESPTP
jgi:hypothetical protein